MALNARKLSGFGEISIDTSRSIQAVHVDNPVNSEVLIESLVAIF